MPTATIPITASADDQSVDREPVTNPVDRQTSQVSVFAFKNASGIGNALLAFDTSSLPDGAQIASAVLRVMPNSGLIAGTGGRSVTAGWYNWDGTDADYTATAETNAHAGTALTSLTSGVSADLALSNLGNISTTGYTKMRLHVSGTQPGTGSNQIGIWSFDNTTSQPVPQLLVTYDVPTFRSSTSKNGTTASVSQSNTVITKPTGLTTGDLMVLALDFNDPTVVTPPDNLWVPITGNVGAVGGSNLYAFYKFATASEAATYTFTFDAARYVAGAIGTYYNINQYNPFNVSATTQFSITQGTTIPAPAITTTFNECMIVRILAGKRFSSNVAYNIVPPAGYTEREEPFHQETGNVNMLELCDKLQATAGTEAAANGTTSGASVTPSAITLALNPIGGPTGGFQDFVGGVACY